MTNPTPAELSAQITATANDLIALQSRWLELDKVRLKTIAELDSEIFAKTPALRSIEAMIESKLAQCEPLEAKVKALLEQHEQIEASIESLRKRIGEA